MSPHLSPQVMQGGWAAYTMALQDKGWVSRCAIYSSSSGQPWAACPNFAVSKKQLQALLHGFQDETELRCLGLQMADLTFTLTRLANRRRMMIGRCSVTGSGCVIYKCGRCVVIATHEDHVQPGACFSAVERLGDLLMDKGY